MLENVKGNTLALNVESSLPQMLVFKDTSSSTLDNSAFIVRSVAKDITVMYRLNFTWINIRESSIGVNIVPEHSTRHKIEIIIILFTQDNTVSHATCVTRDSTGRVNLSSIERAIYVKIKVHRLSSETCSKSFSRKELLRNHKSVHSECSVLSTTSVGKDSTLGSR